ncbi:MAG: hypothetical protein WD069_17450 [Planctomycetales bacterium]
MDRYDELARIKRLLDEGALSPEEYDRDARIDAHGRVVLNWSISC